MGEEEDMMTQEDEEAMENDEEDEDGADEGVKDDGHQDHEENEVVFIHMIFKCVIESCPG